VIDAKEPEPFHYDRDYVVMLSDWTDEDPASLMKTLKKQSDYYNYHKRTVGDFIDDVSDKGWGATVADRKMWAEMKMSPTDLADVSGATYTYLINGHAPDGNWTGLFRPAKTAPALHQRLGHDLLRRAHPGLKMTVVAADGQHVKPVSVDEFRIAVAETYDVIVEPAADAYTLFAQSMDRTGYARGTSRSRRSDGPGASAGSAPTGDHGRHGHGWHGPRHRWT
jgi:FtsP/CotA-like multicopper oxidase with cupredoxin domain